MERTPMHSAPVATTWTPLLEGTQVARALEALEDIARALPEHCSHPGLAGGDAGAALFYGYLAQAQPGQCWEERATTHLDQAVTALGEGVLGPTLYAGFTGIAWAMDHLQGRLLEPSEEDPNEEIDAALEDYLGQTPWKGNYDLISGLVGYGLYALDRVGRPSGRRLLQRVIELLDATKTEVNGGFTWHTAPNLLPQWQRDLHLEGYFNLGLAHGVPAVIALLGQANALGVHARRSITLLEGAVAWLLAQKNPEGSGSCFATIVSPRYAQETGPSRIAWCYGDLGLGVALLWAARSVGRGDWEAEALAIARLAAKREMAKAGVRDAGLCHGAAGNAHIFNRLWQATGEELFREAALTWFEETLALRQPGLGLGGFRAWMPDPEAKGNQEPWVDAEGLLEGAAGIGLALLAAVTPMEPRWDRMLMVTLPPGIR